MKDRTNLEMDESAINQTRPAYDLTRIMGELLPIAAKKFSTHLFSYRLKRV